jgi:hypothetical protein
MTQDGLRVVVVNNFVNFCNWNGSNYSTLTRILDGNARNYYGCDMNLDGTRIVVCNLNGKIYFSNWNGTNYNQLTQTLHTTIVATGGCCMSQDGNAIAYFGNNILYYAVWNGSNYGEPIASVSTTSVKGRNCKFSPDGSIIFMSLQGSTNCYYTIFDGFSLRSPVLIPTNKVPNNNDHWPLEITKDGSSLLTINYPNPTKLYDTNLTYISKIYSIKLNDNYKLFNNTTTANIYQRFLNPIFVGNNKSYDGTTNATIAYTLSGAVSGDSISLNYDSSFFVSSNVGNNILININNITYTGIDSTNYFIDGSSNFTYANITAANNLLTVTFYTQGKVYDGNNSVTVTYSLSGILPNDRQFVDISNIYIPLYRDVNVGTYVPIDITNILLYGSQAYNYNVPSTISITGPITKRYVYATGNDKIYDATTVATLTLSNLINSDEIIYYANFNNKNVGTNKLVTISNVITGTSGGNYQFFNNSTSASITRKPLNGIPNNKTYDGTTFAQITLSGVLINDIVTVQSSSYFENKNVGINKLVTISGLLIGSNSGDYNLVKQNGTANIYARQLRPIASDKYYDKTTNVNITLSGQITGDVINYIANFTNIYPGTNKNVVVTLTNYSDTSNYIIPNNIVNANILKRPIELLPVINNKFYDKTTTATFTYTLSNTIITDSVDISSNLYYANYSDFNAGSNKLVTISNILLYGNDSDYYTIQSYAYARGEIYKKYLYGYASDKMYDQTTNVEVTISGLLDNDTINYWARFENQFVGIDKNVYITLSSSIFDNNQNSNYQFFSNIIRASILQKLIILNFNSPIRSYTGDTNVRISLQSISGLFAGDTLYLNNYTANFVDSAVGENKLINVSNIQLSSKNNINYYTYDTTQEITGTILEYVQKSIFLNSPLLIDGNADVYTQYFDQNNLIHDYILTFNLGSLPNVNGDLTKIFKTAVYSDNQDTYITNLNILLSNELNDFYFNWSDVNQRQMVTIGPSRSNIAFNTFQNTSLKFGDRLLEMVAHKMFGHAQARAAISNDNDFLMHDSKIWDHLSNTMANNQIQNDIMNQYITAGRIIQDINTYNDNIFNQGDKLTNVNFNFNGVSFDFMLYVSGSLLVDNSLTELEKSILSNGPNVGGTSFVNGNYNIPILVRIT